ncbi:MAG: glycosyltransferase, partial [Bacteroidales bacterium]|nr:glycosyltransferase [Bacteroidales bacterium]
GSGPLRKSLKKLLASEHLRRRVSLEGYLSEDKLPSYYGACDIFVLSSIMKTEAFGIVQIEAMSCGKPVVATNIPGSGVSWVNEDGVSGRNVTPGDPEELAAAIQDVMSRYEAFAEGARSRFGQLFSEDRMINSILKIYEALV